MPSKLVNLWQDALRAKKIRAFAVIFLLFGSFYWFIPSINSPGLISECSLFPDLPEDQGGFLSQQRLDKKAEEIIRLDDLIYAGNYNVDYLFVKKKGAAPLEIKWEFEVIRDSTYLLRAYLKPRLVERNIYFLNEKIELQPSVEIKPPDERKEIKKPIVLLTENFDVWEEWPELMHFRWITSDRAKMLVINPNRFDIISDLAFMSTAFYERKTLKILQQNRNSQMKSLKSLKIPSNKVSNFILREIELQPGFNIFHLYIPEGVKNVAQMTGRPDARDLSVAIGKVEFISLRYAREPSQPPGNRKQQSHVWYHITREPYGTEITTYFDQEAEKLEMLPIFNIPLKGELLLIDYLYIDFEAYFERSDIQQADIIFVVRAGGQDFNIIREMDNNGLINFNLAEFTRERLKFSIKEDDIVTAKVKAIYILVHKKWDADCSGTAKGLYNFYFKRVNIYSREAVLKVQEYAKNFEENEGTIIILARNKSINKVNFLHNLSQLSILFDNNPIATKEDMSLMLVFSIPINAPYKKHFDIISFEYNIQNFNDEAINFLLANRSGRVRFYPGKEIKLKNFTYIAYFPELDVDVFQTKVPPFFPYTTEGITQDKFIVYKDGEELETTWKKWLWRKELIEIGAGEVNQVMASTKWGDNPENHIYIIKYIPKEWVSEGTEKGFRKIEFELSDITQSEPIKIESIIFSIYKKRKSQVPFSKVTIRDLKLLNFYAGNLKYLIDRNPGKTELCIMDGKSINLQRAKYESGMNKGWLEQPAVEELRDGFWAYLGNYYLNKGMHTIRFNENELFDIKMIQLKSLGASEDDYANKRNIPTGKLPRDREVILNFTKINPTRYIVDVEAKRSFWLIFSESFHPSWKAYLLRDEVDESNHSRFYQRSAVLAALRDWGNRKELKNHIMVNGYANGWYVDLSALKELKPHSKSFHIILEYKPQRLFEIGLLISLTTLLACGGYLVRSLYKKRRNENKLRKK